MPYRSALSYRDRGKRQANFLILGSHIGPLRQGEESEALRGLARARYSRSWVRAEKAFRPVICGKASSAKPVVDAEGSEPPYDRFTPDRMNSIPMPDPAAHWPPGIGQQGRSPKNVLDPLVGCQTAREGAGVLSPASAGK